MDFKQMSNNASNLMNMKFRGEITDDEYAIGISRMLTKN